MNNARVPLQYSLVTLGLLLSTFALQASDRLEELAKRARLAMQRNDYGEAEREYRAILTIAPGWAEARSNLGIALHMQDKYEQAEKEFRQTLRVNSRLFVPNYFLGIELFKTNRYREARNFLETAMAINPTEIQALWWLGVVCIGLKDYEGGMHQYREILKQDPKNVDALYAIGKIYTDLMERSIKEITHFPDSVFYGLMLTETLGGSEEWHKLVGTELPRILQASPAAPMVRFELGRFALKEGKTEEAKRLFQEELAVDLWSFRAHYGLAQVWLDSHQYKDFSRELEQAVSIRPEFFCPLPALDLKIATTELELALRGSGSSLATQFLAAQLGKENSFCAELSPYQQKLAATGRTVGKSPELLFREKRYEAAISGLESQLRTCPTDVPKKLLLAWAYFETGKLESAARWAEGLTGNPETASTGYYLLSKSYQKLALESLAEIERIAPDSYRAHQLMGEAYFVRQNMPEAISAYKAALKRKPDDAELLFQLGRSHYSLAEFPQAFEALKKSLELDPYNPEANYLIGEGLVYTQEGEKAVPFLKRALELDASMLKVHGELGKAYLHLNQWEAAVKELELASSTDSGGELHYQLFRAYSKLNRKEKAQQALARSQKLREEKIIRERSRVDSVRSLAQPH